MKEKDFVKELGYLGLTMRIKRISDLLMHEGRRLYSELDVDIEPNWYVIFKLLDARGAMAITQIADSILLSHPSVVTIVNKMIKAGYLEAQKDTVDARKRLISLSDKAKKNLPEFQKIWDAGERGVALALQEGKPLEFITLLEDAFFDKGFKDRTLKELE